ncbi:hypothetical protein [Nitrosomonas communis]|uniref:hypothetical protein n=1 Tax=Nitrosomonas communis TaxID=44574 RepID=UPI0034E95F06|nr:hypothetical protein [Nitrosomonas communis]
MTIYLPFFFIDLFAFIAAAHHSGGKPMSHLDRAGFNRPVFVVSAIEPINPTCCVNGIPVSDGLGGFIPLIASVAVGLAHPANCATLGSVSFLSFPAFRYLLFSRTPVSL